MHRHNSYTSLAGLSTLPIILVIVFSFFIPITSESILSPIWLNNIQNLPLKIHRTKNESNPFNEGFMLLADSQKRSSPTISLATTHTMLVDRILPAYNISLATVNNGIEIEDASSSSDHRRKRSVNEPKSDRLVELTLQPTSPENDDGIESFLKANDDRFNKQLLNVGVTIDGSGDTTEPTMTQTSGITPTSHQLITSPSDTSVTFSTTTITISVFETPENLSNDSEFLITVDCTNANETLNNILSQFQMNFKQNYTVTPGYDESQCSPSGKLNLTLSFTTGNSITVINDIFEVLDSIGALQKLPVFTSNRCGDNRTVLVKNVTPCYFINLCYLCGRQPERGACSQSSGLSICSCFSNVKDPSRPYQGDRCYPADSKPSAPSNSLPRWTPIVIGVLAGLAGLFCAITCCLGLVFLWRRRRLPNKDELRIRRLWHLPRATTPKSVAAVNLSPDMTKAISPAPTDEANSNDSVDSTFFQELDQKMGANLRATITRPNTDALIASLPSNTHPITGLHDPIDDLDGIIDNEDVNTIFHDPLNELYDEELLEAINPNLQLPRPKIDSKPTGLFSFLYRS